MDSHCIFCDIVAGTAPASLVHEDELTLVFVDLRQANPGHVLVIPGRDRHAAQVRLEMAREQPRPPCAR